MIDRDGVDGLSMRKLAKELGTGAASLYWHVANKDELLDLVFERVIGEIEMPEPEPEHWTEQVKEVARETRGAIARHRDIVRISQGRFPVGPNALRNTEGLLAILRGGGLSDRLAVTTTHLLFIIINGFAFEEEADEAHAGAGLRDPMEMGRVVSEYFASLPAGRFPNLVATADELAAADMNERFELLLDLFVDGLAARVEAMGHG